MVIAGHMYDKDFLLDLGDGKGQILSMPEGLLYPPTPMSSLTSQGGPWDDYTGPQERLADLLAQVKPAPPFPPPHPGRTHEEVMQLIEELQAELKLKSETP
jgi:hypothetical protein